MDKKWRDYFFCNHIEHRMENNGQPEKITREMFNEKKCIDANWNICNHLIMVGKRKNVKKEVVKDESLCFMCSGDEKVMNKHTIPPSLRPNRNKIFRICNECNKLLQQFHIDLYRNKYDTERKMLKDENSVLKKENIELKQKYSQLLKKVERQLKY